MLILSRKPGESIVIDGRIVIRIMRVEGDVVKIGIEAPIDIPVHRQEVYDEIQKSNKEALIDSRTKPPRLTPGKAGKPNSRPKGAGNHAPQH
jgi:carbon storage regulator